MSNFIWTFLFKKSCKRKGAERMNVWKCSKGRVLRIHISKILYSVISPKYYSRKLFSQSYAIKTLNLKFLPESKSLYNLMAAKMIGELEITYMSFCAYDVIIELDTKKKSRRKIWTREWLLKRNERGAYNGVLNDLRLNEFQIRFSYWNSDNIMSNDRQTLDPP